MSNSTKWGLKSQFVAWHLRVQNFLLADRVQCIHIVTEIRKQINSGRRTYKPSASLTCLANSFCSKSTNSSIRFPQVASAPSSHTVNSSWQQMSWPFCLCACSASMCLTFRPDESRSIRNPNFFQLGVTDSMMFTLSPFVVLSFISCAIRGFLPVHSEHKYSQQ